MIITHIKTYWNRLRNIVTGYYDAGRRDIPSVKSWQPKLLTADEEYIKDYDLIRARSRDLVRNNHLNVNKIKGQLFSFLRSEDKNMAGYMSFPVQYTQEYYKQLTVETLIKSKDRHGFYRYEYKKVRDRNEVLDCTVYARAASIHLGVDHFTDLQWDYLKKKILESKTGSLYHKRQSSARVQVISEGIDV